MADQMVIMSLQPTDIVQLGLLANGYISSSNEPQGWGTTASFSGRIVFAQGKDESIKDW